MATRWSFIFLCFVLVACTSGSGDSSGPGRTDMDGTSDSGGGNGVENKAYEAYIVKPENLPAYKNLIAPKLEQLSKLAPASGVDSLSLIKRWLLYKTWFVAPIELNTISKDVIGISFSPDKTEQLAIQTKKSVWINKNRFAQMSMQDQATLIIHEMVMSLYYLKFKSWNQTCLEKILPSDMCDLSSQDYDLINELFPGTTPRAYNTDDYENIREVTGVLLEPFAFQTAKEVDKLLLANNFDRRFTFGMGFDGNPAEEQFKFSMGEKVSAKDFEQVLSSAEMLNRTPNHCDAVRLKQSFDCKFSYGKTVEPFPRTHISVALENGLEFSGAVHVFDHLEGSSIEVVSMKKKMVYLSMPPLEQPTSPVAGTLFRSFVVVAVQDLSLPKPTYELLGLITVPGVVTGKDNSGDCTYSRPATNSVATDSITVYSKHLSDEEKMLMTFRAMSFPPFTTCIKWN